MGNSPNHEADRQHNIAGIRTAYPLYKTEYTTPEIDHRILTSWCLQSVDEKTEKYLYIIPEEIKTKPKI